MDPNVQALLLSGAQLTDAALERLLPLPDVLPHSIHRAMRHSIFAGGKRLRPILCMEAARMVSGGETLPEGAADLGAALEMLHTYSLIHDDLPALDNDDLRRGQPTCHVLFGEAIAILAGDALQTLAFQTISSLPAPPATTVAILRDVSLAIGTGVGANSPLPPGMIGGQVVDIESEGNRLDKSHDTSGKTPHSAPTADLVESIHRAKTGALITTSIVSGGFLGLGTVSNPGARGLDSQTSVQRLRTFGEKAGLAFQIVDDVLDMTQSSEELGKTAGKDTASIKATWPAVFGIDQSLKDAEELIADAFAALAPFGPAADPLKSLANYLVERKH
jgi:geranylgeranyl diphosphate synthase type II